MAIEVATLTTGILPTWAVIFRRNIFRRKTRPRKRKADHKTCSSSEAMTSTMIVQLLLLLLLLITSTTDATATNAIEEKRELASLAQTWNISSPTFVYASLSFDLDYEVSGFILDDMVEYSIWDSGCKQGGHSVPSNELYVVKSTNASWSTQNADLKRPISLNITVNPQTIQSAPIYHEGIDAAGQVIANISFCVRFSLYTPAPFTVEVNFMETEVVLKVDLTDGFSIGALSVAPKNIVSQSANQVYHVEGYQCGNNNVALTAAQIASTRVQGSFIKVCVRPNSQARNDGIFMRSIDTFTFVRDNTIVQEAVVNGAPASNGLTDLSCNAGNAVCSFETILFAAFYKSAGAVSGGGVATMQLGSQRRLRSGDRELQDSAAGSSEFNLGLNVLPTFDLPGSGALPSYHCATISILIIISMALLLI